MKVLVFFMLLLLSLKVCAMEVLTADEKLKLKLINNDQIYDKTITEFFEKLSEQNKLLHVYELELEERDSVKKQYQNIYRNSEDFNNIDKASSLLIDLLEDKNRLSISLNKKESALSDADKGIKKIQSDLKNIKEKRKYSILKLKKSIISRINNDIKSTKIIDVPLQASIKCTIANSLRQCLNENKESIIQGIINSNVFIDKSSIPLSYKITNASLSLEGIVNYSVLAKFKPVYTKEILALINDELGLSTTKLELKSNVNAKWYLDGIEVANGKKVIVDISYGRHSIVASYKGKIQSIQENILKEDVLYFPFKIKKEKEPFRQESRNNLLSEYEKKVDEVTKVSSKAKFDTIYSNYGKFKVLKDNPLSYPEAIEVCKKANNKLINIENLTSLLNEKVITDSLLKYSFVTYDYGIIKVVGYDLENSTAKKGIVICIL
ncbi:hypothetical protein [Photobacterium damselae]|uniref:hypothetical protein n=1 Tax=Photobacterium damselae TaxID=38293 RepID=UPI00130272BD|nr:hypothetical protein [Photobacterium damselae]